MKSVVAACLSNGAAAINLAFYDRALREPVVHHADTLEDGCTFLLLLAWTAVLKHHSLLNPIRMGRGGSSTTTGAGALFNRRDESYLLQVFQERQ